ncbi:alpha/beta fold hydrolase [Streptomyces sp. NPDC057638]|uniref:alpha/beta fold hydrolase n=1 Tax=Streptomyces sp. NPDC057638 TaxID=3346190 RepID=UPI003692B4E4
MTFPPESLRTALVNGVSLAYRETGTGEPVVFVHGDLSDLRTWEWQLPVIGASYRALAYSRRYARPNADIAPGGINPMPRHVDDLIAFLTATGAAPAHLVGNSWGAFISLLAAVRRPDLVRSLVLEEPPVVPLYLSSPPRPAELPLLVRRPRVLRALARFTTRTVTPVKRYFRAGEDELAMRTFLRGVLDDVAYGRLAEDRVPQMRENLTALRAGLFRAGFPPVDPAAVRGLAVPTLLVTGVHSASLLHLLSERLAELLPDVRSVEIAHASHLMHEENPKAVNDAILGFLGSLGGLG